MSYNPYGGVGSIVMPPRNAIVTDRRLGSANARLTDTAHGRAVIRPKRTRSRNSAVVSNRVKVERILPTLSDDEQTRLARALTTVENSATLNLNIHDK
jgi:hypothetical protein